MTSSVPVATSFSYTGNGVTAEFSFPLRFLENADLAVTVNGAERVIGTHYSVEGAGEVSGGSVTFEDDYIPPASAEVVIRRATAAKQTVDLEDSGRVPGDTLEAQLDRLAMAAQDLTAQIADALALAQGAAGQGVPNGGSAGQVLQKVTGADYDSVWTDKAYDDALDANHIEPTTMYSNDGTRVSIKEGTSSVPVVNNDPVVFLQKYVSLDNEGDPAAHNIGGVLAEVIVAGGTGADENEGTWVGILGNVVLNGENEGTAGSPDYDLKGNAIGLAGFVRSEKPTNGIIAGLWGYAVTPEVTDTEYDNSPFNWTVVGQEINIETRHKDAGAKTVVSGKGTTVGTLLYNFRTQGDGVRDWSFGEALTGTPNDGNFSSTDIDNWSGFHVGYLIDKIKAAGIRFGQYFKTGSYGIRFPDTYAGSQEPAAAIHLGNSKLQMGEYVGSTFANNDFWHNAGRLFFRYAAATQKVLTDAAGVTLLAATHTFSLNGGFGLMLETVSNAVNYLKLTNAATAGTPIFEATGSDTNISFNLKTKGKGYLQANGRALPFVLAASAVGLSHTGDTAEAVLATIAIPAGLLGANGQIEIEAIWNYTNNGNNKTTRVRFGASGAGTGGTVIGTIVATATNNFHESRSIANRNAENSQVAFFSSGSGGGGWGAGTAVPVTTAIDTSAASEIVFTAQCANSGDTITLEGYRIVAYPKT